MGISKIMNIRNYKDEDFPQLEKLLKEGGVYNEILDPPQFFRKNLRKKSELDPDSIIVAEENGKVIGAIILIYDPLRCFLLTVVVDKSYMKRGIGSILGQIAEQRMRVRGAEKLVGLVSEKKLEPIDIYMKKGGFMVDKVYYMMKRL